MKGVKNIFFDLDGTLWDMQKCSQITLEELYLEYRKHFDSNLDFDTFLEVYRFENELLWKRFENNEIDSVILRKLRWANTFGRLGIELGPWTQEMGLAYIDRCPRQSFLFPNARKTLDYLQGKYPLHMITNGWTESQNLKMASSKLRTYFDKVITSDSAKAQKPQRKIFDFALDLTGLPVADCVYIGDNYASDMVGGNKAGWKVIFFNPEKKENPMSFPEINCLSELMEIF